MSVLGAGLKVAILVRQNVLIKTYRGGYVMMSCPRIYAEAINLGFYSRVVLTPHV
jgi:hypothetical protein